MTTNIDAVFKRVGTFGQNFAHKMIFLNGYILLKLRSLEIGEHSSFFTYRKNKVTCLETLIVKIVYSSDSRTVTPGLLHFAIF